MATTKYSSLVESAKLKRRGNLQSKVLDSTLTKSFGATSFLETIARELNLVNRHITVDAELFEEAAQDYKMLGNHLVEKLRWPKSNITVMPQGSTNTLTLIRSPSVEKFDIDAVCAVDISLVEAKDPISFFNKVGLALEDWNAVAKKRCWRVDFINRRHYVEFTPSVPYSQVSSVLGFYDFIRYQPTNRYQETALAVVDTPTGKWKASNPQGFASWVSDQAKRPILISILRKSLVVDSAYANVTPVPEQEIPLTDTLRVAIRLFKRHRDMCVFRGDIDSSLKPISVIIVTLLTQCYEGLADQGAKYDDPIELLADLADLIPGMIEVIDGKYWISNPTVEGENFAERWNDNINLKHAFDTWCNLLIQDLDSILSAKDEQSIKNEIRKAFGSTAASGPPPPSPKGLAPKPPSQVYTPPARGLA